MPERQKPKYTCDNCGSHSYKLEFKRDVKYLYLDSLHDSPIGHEELGRYLDIKCGECGYELFPTDEDILRFYTPKEDPTFYDKEPVNTDTK